MIFDVPFRCVYAGLFLREKTEALSASSHARLAGKEGRTVFPSRRASGWLAAPRPPKTL